MPQQSTTVTFTFTVNAPLLTVVKNPTAPPTFTVGQPIVPYTMFQSVTGGVPPYTYAIDPNTPFPGMSIDASGVLSGTPTTAGSPSVNVIVRDSGV